MHFIIHCLDRPDALPVRLSHYGAHNAYLAQASIKMLVSGPLLGDDGQTVIGSLLLVEADTKDQVLWFHRNDPLYQAGIWERVEIYPFSKRVDNRT